LAGWAIRPVFSELAARPAKANSQTSETTCLERALLRENAPAKLARVAERRNRRRRGVRERLLRRKSNSRFLPGCRQRTQPGDFGVQVEPLAWLWRLDAQSDTRKTSEWSDRLQREARFAQVEQYAAVVRINVDVGERSETQPWDATPLLRGPKILRIERR
jgi:hypothetical protein